jgi:hypothetical protein
MATTTPTNNSDGATNATVATAPRAEEIAAGARRLTDELQAFLTEHPSLQTASTASAANTTDVADMQLATCRKLREVCVLLLLLLLLLCVCVCVCVTCVSQLHFPENL